MLQRDECEYNNSWKNEYRTSWSFVYEYFRTIFYADSCNLDYVTIIDQHYDLEELLEFHLSYGHW